MCSTLLKMPQKVYWITLLPIIDSTVRRQRLTLAGFLVLLALLVSWVALRDLQQLVPGSLDWQVFWQLRLPLVITAIIVGAGLAVSSATLQVVLKNPLADPGMLGITSGASLFAAGLLLLGDGLSLQFLQYGLPLMCFAGALVSTFIIYLLSRRLTGTMSAVILAGIGISTLCGALIAWMHLFSDAQSMRNLTFWLMGSLHQADWTVLFVAIPISLLGLGYLLLQGRRLNLYYFGQSQAQIAGLDVRTFNRRMLLVSAMVVGVSVSIAGSIAFVGLLVPHLLRNFFGLDNRLIMPLSAIVGAILMLCVVGVSDSMAGLNIPVSMLTATLGGPVFLYSLIRLSRKGY